jgi:glycosyltransferase involved in cell wall biosynthesis
MSDAGGPLDIVRERQTGLVVAPRSEDLANALEWLRANEDEAKALGRAGRDVARAVTWDACVERLLEAVA